MTDQVLCMSADKVPNLGLVETVDTEKVSILELLTIFMALISHMRASLLL